MGPFDQMRAALGALLAGENGAPTEPAAAETPAARESQPAERPAPRVPRYVPMPQRQTGGRSRLPAQILDADEDLYVEGADAAKARAVLDAAARAWGATTPQDWKGLEVHVGPRIDGDEDHGGRTLVRKRGGAVAGGRMDVIGNAGDDLRASAIPHEVGHLMLGGDYEHKDARWRDRSFWREVEKQMGLRQRDLDPYVVDWDGY